MMVRFVNRRLQQRRRLTVRRVRSRDGYRLVVTYPDGLQRLHAFQDSAALIAGTNALQAELTAEGWEPLLRPAPRWRPAVQPPVGGRRADGGPLTNTAGVVRFSDGHRASRP